MFKRLINVLLPGTHWPENILLGNFFSTQIGWPSVSREHNREVFFNVEDCFKLLFAALLKINPLSQCNSAVSLTFLSTVSISALATFNEGQFFKTHVYLLTPSKLHSVPYSVQSLSSKQPFQYYILSVVLNSENIFYIIKFLCHLQSNYS